MSYILDALRKSELERQMVAGQHAGMLYPVEIKYNRRPWLVPTLIALAAIVAFALIWRMGARPVVTEAVNVITVAPQAKVEAAIAEPVVKSEKHRAKPETRPSEYAQKIIPVPPHLDTPSNSPAQVEPVPVNTAAVESARLDPLKELPALNITGYIHNEQSGSLAMINNQLVHEGEEVSPGLRLIKVLGDSAIFSYKGYVFTR